MAAQGGPQVYMVLAIGDAAAHAEAEAAYERGAAFMAERGEAYGMGSSVDALDDDGAATMAALYAAEPAWAARGPVAAVPPPSLRTPRLVFELDWAAAPRAAENFRALCAGDAGTSKKSGKPYSYLHTKFHRIVAGFMAQGGDFTAKPGREGSGGESIWGKPFKDEKAGLKAKHDAPGILSMANSGKNSNTSQFFITLAPAPQCDGKHVVFGRLVAGLDVLDRLDQAGTPSDDPAVDVVVVECGVVDAEC